MITDMPSTASTTSSPGPRSGLFSPQMDQSAHYHDYRILRKKLDDINWSYYSSPTFNFSESEALDILSGYRRGLFTLDQPQTIAMLCLYIPVFFIALIGNILVIFVVIKNPHMRRVKNLFLVNLAVADLCVTFICIPMAVGTTLYKLWVYGEVMCKLTTFLQGVSVASSILTLTSLAVDRYFAIKSPTFCGRLTTKCQALKIIIAIWILAALLIGPILYVKRVHREYFGVEPPFEFCVEHWPRPIDKTAYSIFCLIAVYVVPAISVSVCYGLIGKTLCSDELHRKTSDSSSTVMLGRKRVARMLIALIIVFMVCWLPYNIVSLVADITPELSNSMVLPFTLWLGHAHSAINPVLYWFLNKSFRHVMKRAITCHCGALRKGSLSRRSCKPQYV